MDERAAESYLYTIAHELKPPMQEIRMLAEFIEEDSAEELPEQSVRDLRSIRAICANMTDMVQKLMEYTNAGFRSLDIKPISMNHLVRQCFEELVKTCPDRKIDLELKELPEINADLLLIRLAVINILSNCIKFTRTRKRARIRVHSSIRKGKVLFCFEDNGIGLNMDYAGKLFQPFERLQGEKTYEGNGIGLATVKRIAQRFGGDASISGHPKKGCEVTIELPDSILYRERTQDDDKENVIKIGIIGDMSGVAYREERGKTYAYRLAADEINRSGGILGKKIELHFRDDQSVHELTRKASRELLDDEQVNVLMGSTLSPSRDIMRMYSSRRKTLYFDTQQTEGGVCGHYTFCLSAHPEQQLDKMLEYLLERFGPKCYIVAADYNYGILTAEWAKYLIRKHGGEVVGIEYMDSMSEDFNPLIDRIVQVQTDILVSLCVFPNQDRFYIQWHERGMNHIPNATTQVAAEFDQNVTLAAPILENTYVMASFLEESTSEQAQDYVERYRKVGGKIVVPYMNMDTETAYSAIYLYKKAVELAQTTETEAVIEVLESGMVDFDGPGGRVVVRGEDHHTERRMSLFRIDRRHIACELFTTAPIASDYIEDMIEAEYGIRGGIRELNVNAPDTQYNMLINKIVQ